MTAEEAWPAIVSKATHARCLTIISERKSKRYNSRPGKAVNWLSGSMVCDVCSVPVGSGRNKYGPYYRCVQPGVPGRFDGKGYHVSAKTEPIDRYVKQQLFTWLSSPQFIEAYTKGDDDLVRQIEEADAEVKLLRQRLSEFRDQAITGALSAESLVAVEAGAAAENRSRGAAGTVAEGALSRSRHRGGDPQGGCRRMGSAGAVAAAPDR
ncbi:hypothetical protein [Streptomyces sp. NPDC088789]|uniref:hypothetical protein n=1 Tax=Streptomyces sp. NPDC088789 TaxID=3365899 RepID=UPI003826E4C5